MEPLIFVEVLDRRGRVLRRERLNRFPVTIGRGYSNDVILDDRFVSPDHLVVRETNEGLTLEDRDSRNGVFVWGSKDRFRRLKLEPGIEIRAGHTRLRFCAPDQPVPPAAQHVSGALAAPLAGIWAKVAVITGALLLLVFFDALETYRTLEVSDILRFLAPSLSSLLVWSGLWALGNRLVSHEFRFIEHGTIASVAVVILTVVSAGFEYLLFFFSFDVFLETLKWTVYPLVSAGLIYAHLSVVSSMAPKRRAVAAATTVAIVCGWLGISQIAERQDFVAIPEFATELKPVGARWLAKRSAAEFFSDMESLEGKLEQLAKEDENEMTPPD